MAKSDNIHFLSKRGIKVSRLESVPGSQGGGQFCGKTLQSNNTIPLPRSFKWGNLTYYGMVAATVNPPKETRDTHTLLVTPSKRKWCYTPAPMSHLILLTTWGEIHFTYSTPLNDTFNTCSPLPPIPITCLLPQPFSSKEKDTRLNVTCT